MEDDKEKKVNCLLLLNMNKRGVLRNER